MWKPCQFVLFTPEMLGIDIRTLKICEMQYRNVRGKDSKVCVFPNTVTIICMNSPTFFLCLTLESSLSVELSSGASLSLEGKVRRLVATGIPADLVPSWYWRSRPSPTLPLKGTKAAALSSSLPGEEVVDCWKKWLLSYTCSSCWCKERKSKISWEASGPTKGDNACFMNTWVPIAVERWTHSVWVTVIETLC